MDFIWKSQAFADRGFLLLGKITRRSVKVSHYFYTTSGAQIFKQAAGGPEKIMQI